MLIATNQIEIQIKIRKSYQDNIFNPFQNKEGWKSLENFMRKSPETALTNFIDSLDTGEDPEKYIPVYKFDIA